MARSNPSFDVSRVDSMQWNRTINLDALEAFERDARAEPTELPSQLLDEIRDAIRAEVQKTSDDLDVADVKLQVELAPEYKKPPRKGPKIRARDIAEQE